MARVNYSFQKAERERAKLAKKAAKKSAASDQVEQEPAVTEATPTDGEKTPQT